jgi:hypothetical protein
MANTISTNSWVTLKSPGVKVRPHNPAPPAVSDPVHLYTPYPPLGRYFGWTQALATPLSQPGTQGYDANAPRITGNRRAAALNAVNAVLTDGMGPGDFEFPVFVTNVETDTSLSGISAQSNMAMDFYPHNFVQPSIKITGVSLDQQDYALLCEFVHSSQRKAVQNGYRNLTQLNVLGRSPDPSKTRGIDATRTSGSRVMLSNPAAIMPGRRRDPDNSRVQDGTYFNQVMHGSHQPMIAKGYVQQIERAHERFQNAVAWQFEFVIAAMLSGIYTDSPVTQSPAKTWQDLLADAKAQGVVTSSQQLLTQSKAALKYAKQHSATII